MKSVVKSCLYLIVAIFLWGCGGGGSSKVSDKNNTTIANIEIDKIANLSLKEFFVPTQVQSKITVKDNKPYHLYVESSDDGFIRASVDDKGLITISSANKSDGVGTVDITLIAFTLLDVASVKFTVDVTSANLPTFSALNFTVVSDDEWDTAAVSRVLDTFAFGGQATDAQIKTWADMPPKSAIVQMLTFDANNPLLSPVSTQKLPSTLSLEKLSAFWASNSADNIVDNDYRKYYKPDSWSSNKMSWARASMTRGLNPFLNRVGLWETNYHMSANRDSGVYPLPMFHHYDNIMEALASNATYDSVLATGAKNAAIAWQYGHYRNVYDNGIFRGNEDFAREYHQLFFGVLGEYDHDYHETIAIPNTARALTDMELHYTAKGRPDTEITFGTDHHYVADLDILKHTISGANAKEKIEAIAKVDIEALESLKNLPIMIISHFADDNMNDATLKRVRDSWKSMSQKRLLPFLWAYAVSTDFHSSTRYKFETSIDRITKVFNKMITDDSDMITNRYDPTSLMYREGVTVFAPIHDVFGHQTSIEASDNANIFKVNYNRSARFTSTYTSYYKRKKDSSGNPIKGSDGEYDASWEKDWAKAIPSSSTDNYKVDEVAKWLWKRFIGDGLKNYGSLERAHIVALLNGKDLSLFIDQDKPLTVYSVDDIENDATVKMLIHDGSVAKMKLDSSDRRERRYANRRVGLAIAFIVATPYIYAQEGK